MNRQEWLEGLKPGDEVVKRPRGRYGFTPVDEFHPRTVARVLKAVIVLDDGSRFGRSTGLGKVRAQRCALQRPGDPNLAEQMRAAREVRRRVDVEEIQRGLGGYRLSDDEAGKVLDFIAELRADRAGVEDADG